MKFSTDKGNDQRKCRLSLIKIQPNSLTYDKTEKKNKMKYVLSLNVKRDNRDTIHTMDLILILIFFLW